jgi:DNA phosphorothioation-dependent restriction protein DptG
MSDFSASFRKEFIGMARSLSPFTRITLLISELNGNKVEDLTDVKKCDLLHHTAKLHEEIEDSTQKQSARDIGEQGKSLFSSIKSGELAKAETERQTLITACKKLKDLL